MRNDFVNVWLLARDLEGIAAASDDPDLAKLCGLVRANYGYPVDGVLVTPDLRVVGHLNVHDDGAMDPRNYATFLARGLATARGTAFVEPAPERPTADGGRRDPENLVVSPTEPRGELRGDVERRRFGTSSLVFHPIDARGFPGAGTIAIDCRVAAGKAAIRFELCAEHPHVPGAMAPVRTLARVAPGTAGRLVLEFERGARFGLMVAPAGDCAVGDRNAFTAAVEVTPR